MDTAYPVVGGRLDVDLGRRSPEGGQAKVSISFDDGKTWQEAWTSAMGDYARMYIDLDEFFPRTGPARYHLLAAL